ncbi:MAG: hypothetical protein IJR63_01250 [Synergistaceae bacterium]|nr:hypothetical protein [Synergistaceae bacterium]
MIIPPSRFETVPVIFAYHHDTGKLIVTYNDWQEVKCNVRGEAVFAE